MILLDDSVKSKDHQVIPPTLPLTSNARPWVWLLAGEYVTAPLWNSANSLKQLRLIELWQHLEACPVTCVYTCVFTFDSYCAYAGFCCWLMFLSLCIFFPDLFLWLYVYFKPLVDRQCSPWGHGACQKGYKNNGCDSDTETKRIKESYILCRV